MYNKFFKMFSFLAGVIGDWVNYFSDELNLKFDQWIDQHLKDTDLRFPGFHTSS